MERFIKRLITISAYLILSLSSSGQQIPANLTRAPKNGILDESGFLKSHPTQIDSITKDIERIRESYGLRIYLVIEPILIGSTVQEYANTLQKLWVPNADGLVIVYESSSRLLTIGWDIFGEQSPEKPDFKIPSYAASAILNRALIEPKPGMKPEEYLKLLVEKIAIEFDTYHEGQKIKPPAERLLKTTLLISGIIASLTLATLLAAAVVRYTPITAAPTLTLPNVDSTERLGAPCGACVTSRSFAVNKRPPHSI